MSNPPVGSVMSEALPGARKSTPWVRIVIVNYNAGALLQACVDALAAQTMPSFEAVIVDNASTDPPIGGLQLPDARFRIEQAPGNIGFAAGSNLGARGATAPWLAMLNPDTRPAPDWLAELRAATLRHPGTRMFGSTQLDGDDPKIVDGFGDTLSAYGMAWRNLGGQAASELPEQDCEVFSPCAAAALYARSAFEAARGFDESFFCYLEDVDLGFRLRLERRRLRASPPRRNPAQGLVDRRPHERVQHFSQLPQSHLAARQEHAACCCLDRPSSAGWPPPWSRSHAPAPDPIEMPRSAAPSPGSRACRSALASARSQRRAVVSRGPSRRRGCWSGIR